MTADHADRGPDGYRRHPGHGPRLRSDIIDAYVFCRVPPARPAPKPLFAPPAQARFQAGPMEGDAFSIEVERTFLLQLRRTRDPLVDTWHPVMGHIDPAETAVACAARELREELALDPFGPDSLGFWALEQVHPYFVATIDCVVLSPRFACEVRPDWSPTLNGEHSDHRWVDANHARHAFMWPGQCASTREIREHLLASDALCREHLRITPADLSAKPS